MTVLSIVSVLFATVLMGFLGIGKAGAATSDRDVENPRQIALPKRWSNLVIVLTVVYFCFLLAGLSYAGWFHVA